VSLPVLNTLVQRASDPKLVWSRAYCASPAWLMSICPMSLNRLPVASSAGILNSGDAFALASSHAPPMVRFPMFSIIESCGRVLNLVRMLSNTSSCGADGLIPMAPHVSSIHCGP